ncbi:MAG: hypothetical protein ACYTAN_04450 [Planctomycetota bacterium]|jgi:hypothetical protein
MKNEAADFRKVLDLCDELSDIRERLGRRKGEVNPSTAALVEVRQERLDKLWGILEAAFKSGALGELRERNSLTREELFVTALLLSRRIRKGNRGLSGRSILSMLYDSAYDMVRGMSVLKADGSLRRAGIVVAGEPYREDVFETTFRLSDEMFYLIIDEIGSPVRGRSAAQKGFSSAREHLLEMGRLTALYRKRAAMLFPVEAQDFFSIDGDVTLDEIEYRVEAGWQDIEQRLLLTERYEEYPLVRLERTYALSRADVVIIVSLFFVELVSPAPYLVVGDLVKLVSRDEEDLMSNRRLLTPQSPLVKSGIIILNEDHGVHRKLTTYDAFLADWVVDRLAGPNTEASAITTDMQIDVHEFLNGLSRKTETE